MTLNMAASLVKEGNKFFKYDGLTVKLDRIDGEPKHIQLTLRGDYAAGGPYIPENIRERGVMWGGAENDNDNLLAMVDDIIRQCPKHSVYGNSMQSRSSVPPSDHGYFIFCQATNL